MEIFLAVTEERLADVKIEWEEGACVCVVLASGGYPQHYEKGKPIEIGELDEGVFLYHAGTKREGRRLADERRPRHRRLRQGRYGRRRARKGVPQRRKGAF